MPPKACKQPLLAVLGPGTARSSPRLLVWPRPGARSPGRETISLRPPSGDAPRLSPKGRPWVLRVRPGVDPLCDALIRASGSGPSDKACGVLPPAEPTKVGLEYPKRRTSGQRWQSQCPWAEAVRAALKYAAAGTTQALLRGLGLCPLGLGGPVPPGWDHEDNAGTDLAHEGGLAFPGAAYFSAARMGSADSLKSASANLPCRASWRRRCCR
jgi:hypothetical protein